MADGLKVISTYRFSPKSQQVLREAAQAEVPCITNTDEFLTRLKEAEVLCSSWVPDDWSTRTLNLRWLQCDDVVLAIPLTQETEKLIGEAELRGMRPNTYLVNVARGHVIDEKALIRALEEEWIAGAGLDVVEQEPLPSDSPLYSMPNIILTPHIWGSSVNYDKRLAELFADNLRGYCAGEPLRNRYDPARGY